MTSLLRGYALAVPALLGATGVAAQDPPTTPTPTVEQQLEELRERIRHLEGSATTQELEQHGHSHEAVTHRKDDTPNPRITLFADVVGSLSDDGTDDTLNRFSVKEVELQLHAAITSWVDGTVVVAMAEEFDDNAGETEISTVVEIEEAFARFHELPLDLALRAGRFRNAFGQSNRLHTHDLPQVTRPLASQAFFGDEGLRSDGLALDAPLPGTGETLRLRAELVNADSGGEAPLLGGPGTDNPAVLGRVSWFGGADDDGCGIEIGGSYLFSHTSPGGDLEAHVFGVDAIYRGQHAPGARQLLMQGEVFWADNDVVQAGRQSRNGSFGSYAFGEVRLRSDWLAGVRGDYTEFPNDATRGRQDRDWAVSPYIAWSPHELLRLRLEYQHRQFETNGRWDDQDNLFLNLTFAFGAHPAHPWWLDH